MAQRTCSIPDCPSPVLARGWCRKHYLRWYKTGSTDERPKVVQACSVVDCGRPYKSNGYCGKHLHRWKRHGDPLAGASERDFNHPETCTVEGCSAPYQSNGFCGRHLHRYQRHGDPLAGRKDNAIEHGSILDRLGYGFRVVGECFVWQGSLNKGYGGISVGQVDGRPDRRGAHVVAYERVVGPVPAGLELDHLCRNRACINPDHLEPVTHRENIHRSPSNPMAINVRKTHCIHGHEFTPENTYTWAKRPRNRYCKQCMRDRNRRRAET